jgi:uracil-DNA glycosylase
MDPAWQALCLAFEQSAAGRGLHAFLQARGAAGAVIYPPQPLRALQLTALADVRVLIVGQDPYHGPDQADGLAFSVAQGQRIPPSLRNIFKELQRDLGLAPPRHGSLEAWAQRGVLLINTCLTVEQGQPASHAGAGWERLTDDLIQAVAARGQPCVYLLWGAHAQQKAGLIRQAAAAQAAQALILQANHPSPLSALRGPRPFIGCGHFRRAADWLAGHGQRLDWALPA